MSGVGLCETCTCYKSGITMPAFRVAGGLLHECWLYDADQPLIDRLIGP